MAAAFASTSRQIGSSLGVAVIGSAATARVVGSFRSGFAEASHVGWWILTGCALAVLALGVLTTGRWARTTAEAAAERLLEPAPEAQLAGVG